MNYYDLTNPQMSIWQIEEYYKGTNINNICGILTIKEDVDLSKLNTSLNIFIKNNKSFSLNFKDQNGKILQYFTNQEDVSFEVVNLKNYEEVQELARKTSEHIFNIYDKCLYKFVLFKLENGSGGIFGVLHHIISDAATFGIMATEIVENYKKLSNNEGIEEKDYSYENYIQEENEYMNSSKFNKDEEYWNNLYSTIPETAILPSTKFDKHINIKGVSKRKEYLVETNLLNKIIDFCKKYRVSNFNFFMAVYSIYLSRVTGLNDFAIGTPILNRTNFKERHTTGMFINTAALRINLNDSIDFISFVKQVAQNSLSMLRYQKYPFRMLLQNLRKNICNIPSLFDVMLSYQITKTNDTSIGVPYSVEWLPASTISNGLYIHLYDSSDNGSLNIAYDYQVEKYEDQDIVNMHNRIIHIIEQILRNENCLTQDIEIVTKEEKHQILKGFNNTVSEYPKDQTVINLFENQVKKTPKSIALIFENQYFSYEDLNNKANQLASYLIKNGIKPKDIVGIMVNRSPEMIISILAVLKLGAAYLPIDPEYPIDRINYMLSNSNAHIVLVHSNTLNLDVVSNCHKLNVDLNLDIYNNSICENISYVINPEDLIYLIYTSGSTGMPKGVMITHKNITNLIIAEKEYIDFSPNKSLVSVTTFCFDIFAIDIWCTLTSGMKLVLASDMEQLSPLPLKELCEKHNASIMQTTPSRFSFLMAITEDSDFWRQFSTIIVTGEPFPKSLLEKLQRHTSAHIFNMYGPTETTVWSTIKEVSNSSFITIGKPIANTTCYILDKNKKLLPLGIPGNLYIGGDGVASGYLNREDLNKDKFIKSPFKQNEIIYDTGDLAYIDNNYEIVHLGRSDFQVKIRGYRIELEEIEYKLLKFPNITDCIVLPVENANKLCAYYISNSTISNVDLRTYLLKSLPNYMIPNYFIKMDSFPHTPNGKIDKKSLPLPSSDTYKKVPLSNKNIDALPKQKEHKILYEFNNKKMEYPKDKTIIELFEKQAKSSPDAIAVIFEDKKLTYRELNEKANALAFDLECHNVQYKDVVGVFLPRSIELVISIFAILKCGATYEPIYINYPDDRINYMIKNSNTKLVLTNTNLNSRLNSISSIILDNFEDINSMESFNTIPSIPNDVAYIIYTSGSTGTPKGVQITNKCLNNFICSFNKYFGGISSEDKFLSSTSISFDVSIFELFLPLLNGASLVLYHSELINDIIDYCDYIIKHAITGLYIPPNILDEVYSIMKDKNNIKINKLLVGVEAIRKDTIDKYFLLNPNMHIINGYGPTETTICCTALPYTLDLNISGNIIPIGSPLYNNNIYILDDDKNLQPIGKIGELCVTGDGVGAGYINNENETSKNYVPNTFDSSSEKMYKTGDLGKWNDDGTITLVGRKDNQVKISGYRIELDEINTVIMNYPNIEKSITIALDLAGKKRLVSYFTSSSKIPEQKVLQYLREKLASYMIPDKIMQLDAFPLTSNGKIDKKALPTPLFESKVEYAEPKNATQKTLYDIWTRII